MKIVIYVFSGSLFFIGFSSILFSIPFGFFFEHGLVSEGMLNRMGGSIEIGARGYGGMIGCALFGILLISISRVMYRSLGDWDRDDIDGATKPVEPTGTSRFP